MELIKKQLEISDENPHDFESEFEPDVTSIEDMVVDKKTKMRFYVKLVPITALKHTQMLLRAMYRIWNVEMPTHYCVVNNVPNRPGVWIALLFNPKFGIARQSSVASPKSFGLMARDIAIAFNELNLRGLVLVEPKKHEIVRINSRFYIAWSPLFAAKASLPFQPRAGIEIDTEKPAVTFSNPVYTNSIKSDYTELLFRQIDPQNVDLMLDKFYVEIIEVPASFVPHIIVCILLAVWRTRKELNDFKEIQRALESYCNSLSDITPTGPMQTFFAWKTVDNEQRADFRFLLEARLESGDLCHVSIGNTAEVEFFKKVVGMADVCEIVQRAFYYKVIECERTQISVVTLDANTSVSIEEAVVPGLDIEYGCTAIARNAIEALHTMHKHNLHHGSIAPEKVRVFTNVGGVSNVRLTSFFDWKSPDAPWTQYRAPELYHQQPNRSMEKEDIWALGVCIARLIHRSLHGVATPLFVREFEQSMFDIAERNEIERSIALFVESLRESEERTGAPPILSLYMKNMLAYNPGDRSLLV